ncbi:MAG: RidA family protein [Oscillospiraceae bacterium]|nr:RidA family protein [Oscillospiraceae bacterium]
MKIIETKNAPAAIGPYSQAIAREGLVFTSGQIPIDPATGNIEAADVEGQARQAIKNLAAVLEAAGSGLDRVVKTTCVITDMDAFGVFNAVYAEMFPGKPARSCVEVSKLPKGALVEIEAVAEI